MKPIVNEIRVSTHHRLKMEGDPDRMLLACQRNIKTNITGLINAINNGEHNPQKLVARLEAAHAETEHFGAFLSSFLDPSYYNEYKQENSTIASKVFGMPQILEMMLEHLEAIDILNIYQTCRRIRDIIESSTKVQKLLFLQPSNQKRMLQLPPPRDSHMSELVVQAQSHHAEIHVLYTDKKIKPLIIGSRWKRMFICQPPIKDMELMTMCRDSEDSLFASKESYKLFSLSSENGITVGDVFQRAKRMREEHEPHLANHPSVPRKVEFIAAK